MTNLVIRGARAGEFVRRERPVRPGLVLAVVLIGQFMAVLDSTNRLVQVGLSLSSARLAILRGCEPGPCERR